MKLLLSIFFMSTLANANENHKHREHSAHAHGAGSLGIAFEGAKGIIDFKIPSESIFGFEYTAKSDRDKKNQTDGLKKLENNMSEMLSFDASLNCKISKEKIEVISDSVRHSNTLARFSIICDKSPIGTEIIFNFQKYFPKIKDLDVQVIADNVQKSAEATQNNTKLLLK